MKILITGSAGMLGSALVREFRKMPHFEIIGLNRNDLDLRDSLSVHAKISQIRPHLVVHAAALVGGIQANVNDPFHFLSANLQMDSNVLNACIAAGVENFVYVGSSCMYPKDYRQPLKESDLLAAPLEPTNEGYALAKITGAKLCEFASSAFGLSYRTIIPSNLFGPGDNFAPSSSHLVASTLRKVHEARESLASNIEVWGSGLAKREFTFVDDLAIWLKGSLGRLSEFPSLLNVGSGHELSVKDYYLQAMKAIGYEAELDYKMDKPEGMRVKLLDSSIARDRFSWNPQTEIVAGMKKTYEWFLSTGQRRL